MTGRLTLATELSLDNLPEETVPDSIETTIEASSPDILGNLTNMFSAKTISDSGEDNNSTGDSQETHLSNDSTQNVSMDIPVTERSGAERSMEQAGAPVKDIEMVGHDTTVEAEKTEQSCRIEDMETNDTQADSDATQLDHSQMLIPEKSLEIQEKTENDEKIEKYDKLHDDMEKVDKKITKLLLKLSEGTSELSDEKLNKKEAKLRWKIGELAARNKTEKEDLLDCRKKGVKIPKVNLLSLAKCHRKLVSIVQKQKSLTSEILNWKKNRISNAQNLSQYAESSQSLLSCSTLPNERGCFTQIKCLPPSILKKTVSNPGTCEAPVSQKKVVKFLTPYKEPGNNLETSNTSETAVEQPMQTQTMVQTVCDVPHREISNQTVFPAAKSASKSQGLLSDGKEKSISLLPNLDSSGVVTSMDCDNESVGSGSLISGLSSFDVPLPAKTLPNKLKEFDQMQWASSSQPIYPTQLPLGVSHRTILQKQNMSASQLVMLPQKDPLKSPNQESLPDLSNMMERGLISPGNGIIECAIQEKLYVASLLPSGVIQSAGGEVFRSPMMWMKALLGQKQAPSRLRAYKTVTCNGRSLFEICTNESQTSSLVSQTQNLALYRSGDSTTAGSSRTSKAAIITRPIPVHRVIVRLPTHETPTPLQNCRVSLIQDDELMKISDVFPGYNWNDVNSIPRNIEDFFT